MPDRYQPLRDAIAAGPTPGPWDGGKEVGICGQDEAGIVLGFVTTGDPRRRAECAANAALIAAADPDTIAALLAERDALRRQLFSAVAEIEVWSLYAPRHVREAQDIDDVLERHRAALADGEKA